MPDSARGVQWQPWGREAFDRARTEQKPVLLSVGASWSLGCAAMLRTTYRDEAVVDRIDRFFIPVWVDADDRPDITDRYSLGGWPTTAFLTADGQMLGGQTFTEPAPMVALLERVADACAAGAATRPTEGVPAGAGAPSDQDSLAHGLDPQVDSWLRRQMLEVFDTTHGGFGHGAKRIQEAPLQLALTSCGRDDPLCPIAARTLDAIGSGPLFDHVDGGVFRYAERRDWSGPHVEKLLGVNASALRLFLEGWKQLQEPRYRQWAIEIIRYVGHALVDEQHGGFFSCQPADDVYYAAEPSDRARLESPPVDRAIYTEANAEMARAYVSAAALFEDQSLLDHAVGTLERVVGETYRRGEGVARRADDPGGTRGLLVDQVAASEALLDAGEATDRDVYVDLAQELMLYALRSLTDGPHGAFMDRVGHHDDVGLLKHPVRPFALNCRAAGLLARLAQRTERSDFAERATVILASQTDVARSHGLDAAWYVLALRDVGVPETS